MYYNNLVHIKNLVIEITDKNKNIKTFINTIDNVFKKFDQVSNITIIDNESSLMIEKISYIMINILRTKLNIKSFNIITNGKTNPTKLKSNLSKFVNYMKKHKRQNDLNIYLINNNETKYNNKNTEKWKILPYTKEINEKDLKNIIINNNIKGKSKCKKIFKIDVNINTSLYDDKILTENIDTYYEDKDISLLDNKIIKIDTIYINTKGNIYPDYNYLHKTQNKFTLPNINVNNNDLQYTELFTEIFDNCYYYEYYDMSFFELATIYNILILQTNHKTCLC